METTLDVLVQLAHTIEKQIEADSRKVLVDPVEKLIIQQAKTEVLIEIYKFINNNKDV